MGQNKYIGYITNRDTVIFKANNTIYEKKIKERNKIRTEDYYPTESVNIVCNNLDNKYVYIDSNNRPYFNKITFTLLLIGVFLGIICCIITASIKHPALTLSIIVTISLVVSFFTTCILTILLQGKKIFKNCTAITEGEIINYARIELRHDPKDIEHSSYSLMYKYKLPNGTIIHSVLYSYSAKVLYKNYPLNKRVLIRYNPYKCTESCLIDEYESVFNGKKIPKHSSFVIMTLGTITNIITKSIDEEVEDYLKEECLIDYIECTYNIGHNTYKNISIFGVKHNRFKIGQKIRIFYEHDNHNNFYCDVEKRISNTDKY